MDWIQTAQNVGLPVTLLFMILTAGWISLKWVGINIAIPLVKKHVELVDSMIKTQAVIVETQGRIVTALDSQTEVLSKIVGALSTVQTRLSSTAVSVTSTPP